MNNRSRFLPFLLVVVLFACKSRKHHQAPVAVVVKPDSSTVNNNLLSAESLLSPTIIPWTYFSSKANIDYTNGDDNQNVSSNIRMYKDSLVWISVNVFGIEGARILINRDSMVVCDKLHKTYQVYNKQLIENVLGAPLTVTEIQNVILAKPVYSLKLYEIVQNSELFMKIHNEQPKVNVNHIYQKQFYNIDTTLIEDKTRPQYARISYGNYVNINDHNFPLKSQVNAYNGLTTMQIKMEFENPDFVTAVSFPFNIPKTYERIK